VKLRSSNKVPPAHRTNYNTQNKALKIHDDSLYSMNDIFYNNRPE
jgi:hypothetical protein